VALSAPDEVSAWGIAYQIASGEYSLRGLEPYEGDRVIDIGANVGVYALWAARRGATVTAYEPSPTTFGHLRANTRRHAVKSVQAAVVGRVAERASVRLYLHDERSTRNSLLGREVGSGARLGRHVDVAAIEIDEVLAEPCDLLKIDCEGAEFAIFDEVGDAALRRTRRVVVEFHRIEGDPTVLIDRLHAAGFHAHILAGKDPAQPFGLIGAHRR
jgi:FkbM family methyltransferase